VHSCTHFRNGMIAGAGHDRKYLNPLP